jgi:predicted extracellular nuclease
MKNLSLLLGFLCLFAACKQKKAVVSDTIPKKVESTASFTSGEIGIAFYNVENLYDTQDDPKTDDAEFLPDSKLKWTEDKYKIKLANIAKVISQLATDGPEVFGLVEVENKAVIQDLIAQKSLQSHKYQIIHEDSKDARGVDVALCYDPSVFQYVQHKAFTPKFTETKKTRDFLVVEGKINNQEVYFVVNHWPSRREGQEESEIFRVQVAEQVKHVCDSIQKKNPKAYICLMGDFNDDPINKSMEQVLAAKKTIQEAGKNGYFNAMYDLYNTRTEGTLQYNGAWNVFDQFILNANLVNGKGKIQSVPQSANVFHPEWMRVGYGKSKDAPRRSVFKSEFRDDGYSDHFPIEIKWQVK